MIDGGNLRDLLGNIQGVDKGGLGEYARDWGGISSGKVHSS